jgi:xanthine/CO dehydrogenase XdhC/CoxF family maturation factor
MLIEEDGSYVGAISGGCLERDVVRTAWAGAHQPQTLVYDTRANAFFPHGQYGTGCDGVVRVLMRTLPFSDSQLDHFDLLRRAHADGRALAMAHVYDDSAGESVGATAVLDDSGVVFDSGFDLYAREPIARLLAQTLSERETSGVVATAADGRELAVLLEFVPPPHRLVVFGSGPDVQALVDLARPLGWAVTVASTNRIKLETFRDCDTVAMDTPGDLRGVSLTEFTSVVMMTHSFGHDLAALPTLLGSAAWYVGLLGPSRRTARLMSELHERGDLPSTDQLERLHAPVGLDLGGDDPWEVATSIVAQIVAAAHGRDGASLQGRRAPIHAPHELREVTW